MWFEFVIGVTAVLSDLNIIAVSGVLMTFSQTKGAYEFSSLTALVITGWMVIVNLVVIFWWRRQPGVRNLPRQPETVGVVLSYLCNSKMAYDFANMGMEGLNEAERDEMILSKGMRYRFGVIRGEDGKDRYTVDYDDPDVEVSGEHLATNATAYAEMEDRERQEWLASKLEKPATVAVREVREVDD